MGIYDRDYYRREGPSFLSAITDRGRVCRWLVGINVAVFVLQVLSQQPPHFDEETFRYLPASDPITDLFALSTEKVLQGQVWRLLSCAFLHASLWHIFFNMLFLLWFGGDVEDVYGSKEFLAFYLFGTLFSSMAYVGWQMVAGDTARAVGASGAITAVMVLFAMHYPTRTICIWFIPVPIWFFVLFQVIQDSYIFLGGFRTGVAVTAHLGGAAFGFAYYKMQWRMLNLLPSIRMRAQLRARPRLRVVRDDGESEAVSVAAPPAAPVDEQLEAKVDAVLEKVSRQGQESLTEQERELLRRAGEVYRKRRS